MEYRFPPSNELNRVPGVRGVFLLLPASDIDSVCEQLNRWFSEREEVAIVDYGDMDKFNDMGYILIEWYGYDIDRLFLTILDQGDPIDCANYATYMRGDS